MPLKCIFFAPAAAKITVFLSFMLVYRASLDKHKTLSFASLAAGQNRSIFSFVLVYRTPLDKQKTQNYARCRREKYFRRIC